MNYIENLGADMEINDKGPTLTKIKTELVMN